MSTRFLRTRDTDLVSKRRDDCKITFSESQAFVRQETPHGVHGMRGLHLVEQGRRVRYRVLLRVEAVEYRCDLEK
jgi:hypothetical protein